MRVILTLFLLVPSLWSWSQDPLFVEMPGKKTGVTFRNMLRETPSSNVLTYEYFYNGGGVAIGDVNNDGLDDIYFTGNMTENKLYLNEGGFRFRDISEPSGTSCRDGWKTGVTMADVNGDNLTDIYVCFSGKGDPGKRRNKLFINNGDLTFAEHAREYGLDDPGHSTHASFFDFDRDGDLDMYLLNHNVTVIREFEFAAARETRHPYAGDKLFRNDNGKFRDISEQAGIKGNPLGFGLGVSVADINSDGWPDIYVSNDYIEPDYLYINNGDGTFTDRMTEYMQHISYFSMGCDVSDINNDAWPDIFTVDMLPEDNKRQKLLYGPENYEHFALMVLNGFYFQNMRNMLHLNNGNGTYSEIGQLAGISNTDWSWAPLIADYDNDGWKDLFITNGYFRDYTNRDFLKYKGDYYFQKGKAGEKADTFQLVSTMTSTPVHDYLFRNNGDLTFADKSASWGFGKKDFSNGAAYGDLDNDGDLDLVVNHQNETASVYRNTLRETAGGNFLQLSLTGRGANTRAVGARIFAWSGGKVQYHEQFPARGFQSSVSHRIHLGLGRSSTVDSLAIIWPSGKRKVLYDIRAGQHLKIVEGDENTRAQDKTRERHVFTRVEPIIKFVHTEPGFNDFKRQPLLLSMFSTCGPVMDTADVNGDRTTDVFVGGTEGSPARIFIQNDDGNFLETPNVFPDSYTDADARFIDVDNDGDKDLYIVSGGYNEFKARDPFLQDRLYINNGSGTFSLQVSALPPMLVSKSCVAAADFDHDGDVDLFVGGRVIPGRYPETPESFLLVNNGSGKFQDVAGTFGLSSLGLVTDAEWMDLNGDQWEDLVVAGEFMSIEVLINSQGKRLERKTPEFLPPGLSGFWNRIAVCDFDADGDKDIIAGNLGLNTQFRATDKEPVTLVFRDFDKNGSVDPILNYYIQGKDYPFPSRDELLDQMYSMRSRYTSYESYADARLNTIFPASDLKEASTLTATELRTIYLENKGGRFEVRHLPAQAQFAPVYAIMPLDYDRDGNMDFILSGNQSSIRIRIGVIDANFGQLFRGDGKGNFSYVEQGESGLRLTGDARSLKIVPTRNGEYLLVGINNVGVESYRINR